MVVGLGGLFGPWDTGWGDQGSRGGVKAILEDPSKTEGLYR